MKHRICLLAVSILLAALIIMLLPVPRPEAPAPGSTPATTPSTVPGTSTAQPYEGVVRFYCCDEALVDIYAELALRYTAETGTLVVLQTAAEADCAAALEEYMQGPTPPAVLCMHTQADLDRWQDILLDLQDTDFAAGIYSSDFGFWSRDGMLAVAADVEGYGLLVNAQVLSVAQTRNDITSLEALTTAVQILKSGSIDAFPMTSFTDGKLLRLLHGGSLADIRTFLDLYRNNSNQTEDAIDRFLDGKCAFYLGGNEDYVLFEEHTDRKLQPRDLDILPTFTAGAMQYICKTAWGINTQIRQEDMYAALDFLSWLVTAGKDGTAPADALPMLTPFRAATRYDNQLEKKMRGYMQTEAAVLQWDVPVADYSQLLNALKVYMTTGTEESWEALTALLSTP